MKKWQLTLLLAMYVAVATWIGFLSADPDLVDAFSGSARAILVVLLALMYAVIATVTVWLVSFLTRIVRKLTAPAAEDADRFAPVARGWVILALLARIPALLGRQFWGADVGVVLLLFPLVHALVWIARQPGRGSKWLAVAPLAAYLAVDAFVLLSDG